MFEPLPDEAALSAYRIRALLGEAHRWRRFGAGRFFA
jgi:hypothetical protein